ncbi:hypothetical protein RYX36_004197 [Vicia faba]
MLLILMTKEAALIHQTMNHHIEHLLIELPFSLRLTAAKGAFQLLQLQEELSRQFRIGGSCP